MMKASFDRAMMHQKLYFDMAMIIFLCTLHLSGPQCFIKCFDTVMTHQEVCDRSMIQEVFL